MGTELGAFGGLTRTLSPSGVRLRLGTTRKFPVDPRRRGERRCTFIFRNGVLAGVGESKAERGVKERYRWREKSRRGGRGALAPTASHTPNLPALLSILNSVLLSTF
jgi:hypothetical protein